MSKKCILLVEDDEDIRDSIQEVLDGAGYDVVATAGGEVALERLREGLVPALVLCDYMMPKMNGAEFIEAMRKEQSGALAAIPIIVLSAAINQAESLRALRVEFLRKPISIDGLIAAVERYF